MKTSALKIKMSRPRGSTSSSLAAKAALFLGFSVASSAIAYDAGLDFSPTLNPNGVWSYGYSTTLSGNVSLYTIHGSYPSTPFDYWSLGSGGAAPSVFHNSSGNTITNNSGGSYQVWSPHLIGFHPGQFDERSTIRFTAPAVGQYHLTASFSGLDSAGTTTDVHILKNSVSIYEGNVNGFLVSTAPFDTTLLLQPGDLLDFKLGYGSDGNYASDTTGLSAQIVLVPEPGTGLVALAACCAVIGARRVRGASKALPRGAAL